MTRVENGAVWVVAGPPGAGKSAVAQVLARELTGALLDKDTVYGGFVAGTLAAAGRPAGEREGSWYDEHIKVHEYAGLAATTAQVRASGCPVVLVAPFTGQIHDERRWAAFVDELGGPPVALVWLWCDPETLRQRILRRGSERDGGKLARFDEFVDVIRLGQAPRVPHHAVDNRAEGIEHLAARVREILTGP